MARTRQTARKSYHTGYSESEGSDASHDNGDEAGVEHEQAPDEAVGADEDKVAALAAALGRPPARTLPHGLKEATLASAVKELTKATEGLTAEEAEDALLSTAGSWKNFEQWLNDALVHIATVREVRDEAADMRQAMEVSLAQEAARRAAEAAEAATRPMSAQLLQQRHRGSKLLAGLVGPLPHELLVVAPLLEPLKALLGLEKQCRTKWYPGPGTEHYFTSLAGDLVAAVNSCREAAACSVDNKAPAAAAAADAEGVSRKRKRSEEADDAAAGGATNNSSPLDIVQGSDQAIAGSTAAAAAHDDGTAAAGNAAAGGAGDANGTDTAPAARSSTPPAGQQQAALAAAGPMPSSRSSTPAPSWLPSFAQAVQQRLAFLQQELAVPERRPPIFQLPEGYSAGGDAADSDDDDDVVVTDIVDRKAAGGTSAAAAAAAALG